ncbi:MAG TPA: hypothetical protein VEF03_12240 [Candidatus Binataceae bacterium]|nr:hypothetical protein [Candidatus Binataceae bacterium]
MEEGTKPPQRRGLLLPVANPESVGPLIAIAFAAKAAGDPDPLILAMSRREERAGKSAQTPPATPALNAAIEFARALGEKIETRAIWSDDPAHDLTAAAIDAGRAWTLLGFHRGGFGGTMGGVVHDVFAAAREFSVGVFIHGTDQPIERVSVALDGRDGRAALDLAVRIARNKRCKLRALLVSYRPSQPEDDLLEMLRDARAAMGKLFHSDVLTERSLRQLFKQTPGRLLIIGRKLAEELKMPFDEVPGGDRCVIVVQGPAEEG